MEAEISAFLNRYIQTKQPTPVLMRDLKKRLLHCQYQKTVGEPKKEPMSRTLIQQDEDRETQPREEDEISRHIHEVFDQGLNHLPDGIVENPWSDLRDKTEKAADPALKNKQKKLQISASLAQRPCLQEAIIHFEEVLDRPQISGSSTLWGKAVCFFWARRIERVLSWQMTAEQAVMSVLFR